ncbi:TKL protein kinase [Phytophthora cinnamomi]|uniref:TKL protein kinase n=1 Tax=Phytophthora cinnamomi TaxID=4785 RepID=UPI00355A3A6C|nr:TKL protein kinase [Phytophthora cinnamomi]
MDTTTTDALREIYRLRNACHRQRRVNRRAYERMVEIYAVLQTSGLYFTDSSMRRRTAVAEKFSTAVARFLQYLKNHQDMNAFVRFYRRRSCCVQGIHEGLENMRGDIRLTHDQILDDAEETEPGDNQDALTRDATDTTDEVVGKIPGTVDNVVEEEKTKENESSYRQPAPMLEEAIENPSCLQLNDTVEETPEDEFSKQHSASSLPATTGEMNEETDLPSMHSSVPLLIHLLDAGDRTAQQKEKTLLDLMSMCATHSVRVQVYKANAIPVLMNLVRSGETFHTQLYSLHCLSWFTFSFLMPRESDFVELYNRVREPTHVEMLSLLHDLQSSDDEEKEHAALRCSCMTTRGAGHSLCQVGVLPLLIGLLRNGATNQALWATETLRVLTSDDEDNCAAIIRGGAIPPLVGLLRIGTDMHIQEAACILGNLAACSEASRVEIAREGAIPPLVAFMKSITDEKNQWAVYALGWLSLSSEETRVMIAEEGAIPPLVELLRVGKRAQKQWAAFTLGNLAHTDANREEITLQGAVTPLVELLRSGTRMEKQRAAFGLVNLVHGHDEAARFDEFIMALIDLVEVGSDTQKEDAAYTLGNLACSNDDRRARIASNGGIAPLVKLLATGNGEQKQLAAYALRWIAHDNDWNRAAIVNICSTEINTPIDDEATQLHDAALRGQKEVAKLLSDLKAGVNIANGIGWTPLIIASQRGHVDITTLLLEKGVDVNMTTSGGRTALALAADEGHLEVVRLLLSHGADVNASDAENQTALMKAANRGNGEIVRLLLDNGAAIDVTDSSGRTAAEIARLNCPYDIRRILQDYQADHSTTRGDGTNTTRRKPDWFIPSREVRKDQQPFSTGSFGKVYRGWWLRTRVVIKTVTVANEKESRTFHREVRIWQKARHPNIVPFFGACDEGSTYFFVCEEAKNGKLLDYLYHAREEGRSLVWRKLLDAALGLHFLHERHIVHSDLKCNQILVSKDGVAMLTDFGLSFLTTEQSGDEETVGAIRWKAPEVIRKDKPVVPNAQSDVYSFGMCVVEAVTSDVPWGQNMLDAVVKFHVTRQMFMPRPKAFVNDAQWELVLGLCAFDPSERMKLSDAIEMIRGFAEEEERLQAMKEEVGDDLSDFGIGDDVPHP